MGKTQTTWYNYVKYSTRPYSSSYEPRDGKRWLVLRGAMEDGQAHEVWFRSHFEASKAGWKRASK